VVESFHFKLYRSVSEGVVTAMATVRESTAQGMAPAAEQEVQAELAVGDEARSKRLQRFVMQWLTISYAWFGIFLMLQGCCCGPFGCIRFCRRLWMLPRERVYLTREGITGRL
jgi:hypothetical protein